MTINHHKNGQKRIIGTTPRIGIRPVIDGRRKGVRESLEEQTMNMAKNAAKFISENVIHSNGMPVECVIADTCIGGVAEAAKVLDHRLPDSTVSHKSMKEQQPG